MKILVTGANGFVGRVAVSAFAHDGHEVYGLDLGPCVPSAKSLFRRFYEQDIRAPFALQEPVDCVVHLAAHNITHVGDSRTSLYDEVNVAGTRNLVRAAKTPVFVFLSTAKVYRFEGHPLTEDSPLGPVNPYEKSKLCAEDICRKEFVGSRLCIFRPVNIIGPGQAAKAVVPVLFQKALKGEPLEIFGESAAVQLLFVADVMAAILTAAVRPQAQGAFNLAPADSVRLLDLAEKIKALCRSRSPITLTQGPSSPFSPVLACKAGEVLGWAARTSVDDMLKIYHRHITGT